tara:strand:+ start:358 stop:504 length:147 start_codon:yes stop_codon:yes gene_type:complete
MWFFTEKSDGRRSKRKHCLNKFQTAIFSLNEPMRKAKYNLQELQIVKL